MKVKIFIYALMLISLLCGTAYAAPVTNESLVTTGASEKQEDKIDFAIKPFYKFIENSYYLEDGSLSYNVHGFGAGLEMQYKLSKSWRIITGLSYAGGNSFNGKLKVCNEHNVNAPCEARAMDLDVDWSQSSVYIGLQENIYDEDFGYYSFLKIGYNLLDIENLSTSPSEKSYSASFGYGLILFDTFSTNIELALMSSKKTDGIKYSTDYEDVERRFEFINAYYMSFGLGYKF